MAGLRSGTLSGHPDDAARFLRLSERLRNLVPRLRSSEAFFSSDFRLNHSNETPTTIPVQRTNANLNQRPWPSARKFSKAVVATASRKTAVAIALGSEKTFSANHFSRMGANSGISRRPQIPNRDGLSHLDIWHTEQPSSRKVAPNTRPSATTDWSWRRRSPRRHGRSSPRGAPTG
jgi:hypothetical protein